MKSAFYALVIFINTAEINDVYSNAAKKILENINIIPDSTIIEVADFCFVSTATISRLCRKLNYNSFGDFKRDVVKNLSYFNHDAMRLTFDHQLPLKNEIDNNNTKVLFTNHFENIINNLRATYNNISFDDLEDIVDRMYKANKICFVGNFFTQSVAMQLQIELSYYGKDCTAMYPLSSQLEIIHSLDENDLVIMSSIAGGYMKDHPDMMREITKSKAYKVGISQLEQFEYSDKLDVLLKVGTDHQSLIGKFSITYIFEVLEALYHLKYGN